ncbi:hypothetical protein VQH23_06020 [Pararoseomonas sp. SCSIO 73927]|uniref:hypothetical protein n=1 Tax=Pararoseomonas sp. SCSIO 73927 TaxID=3114537 RepID=UPI0030CA7CEB
MDAVAKEEPFRERLAHAGLEPLPGDAAFAAQLARDRERWGEVIRNAGIRAD